VYSKGIPETMRTDTSDFSGFRISQVGQTGFLGTLTHDLPGSVSVDAEEIQLTIPRDGTTLSDKFPYKIRC
jgi:hypothetical protein